jgi:hypothetical protein
MAGYKSSLYDSQKLIMLNFVIDKLVTHPLFLQRNQCPTSQQKHLEFNFVSDTLLAVVGGITNLLDINFQIKDLVQCLCRLAAKCCCNVSHKFNYTDLYLSRVDHHFKAQ